MARITLPSYIKGGHGRMEDAVIVTRKGTTYMMIYKKRDGVLTQGQLAVRQAFSTVVADWKYLGGVIHMSWENMAGDSSATGYNEFIGENVQRRRAGEPLLLCPGTGEELLMNFTAAPGAAAGSIACSFLPPEQGCHVTFFTRRVTMPGVKAPVTRYDADAQSPFTITGLEPDAQYHVYAVVTDAAYEEASTVSASVAAVSAAG